MPQKKAAAHFHVAPMSVNKWARQYRQGGFGALIPNPPGKPVGTVRPKPWKVADQLAEGGRPARDGVKDFMPTPDEIAASTARIRETWSAANGEHTLDTTGVTLADLEGDDPDE